MQALILAGGMGSRLGLDRAKCSVMVLDIPIIKYVIDSIEKCGITDISIVVGYRSDDIIEVTDNKFRYIIQEKQLGTGDAVRVSLDYINDDVLIIPGDTLVLDDSLKLFLDYHLKCNNDFSIMSVYKDNPLGYGRVINDGCVRIVEECFLNGLECNECNSGIYIIKKDVLFANINKIEKNCKNEYYFTDICNFLDGYKVGSFLGNKIYGINSLNDLCMVNDVVKNEVNNRLVNSGVYILDKNSTYISPDSVIEANTFIEPSIIYHSKIGKNNKILGNCRITNSVIGDNNKVISSVISDSLIGTFNKIGPFAHFRNYANIGNYNRIGNFVEIKDSVIDSHTNAAHLAYIGNTYCGSYVNFGCGSITVNYDGKNKHKTIIKDRAFIGCNSNLIAPIIIKENSFVAAGSTITSDVEEDSLAIARARQVNKKDYLKNKNCSD